MIEGLSERLMKLRQGKGVSQVYLAKRIGITKSSVYAWEIGKSQPSLLCLMKLAYFFGVTTDYLLGVDKKKTIDITGLNEHDEKLLIEIADTFKGKYK